MTIYLENMYFCNFVMYAVFIYTTASFLRYKLNVTKVLIVCCVLSFSTISFNIFINNQVLLYVLEFLQIVCLITFSIKQLTIKKIITCTATIILLSNLFSIITQFVPYFKTNNNTYPIPSIVLILGYILLGLLTRLLFDIIFTRKKRVNELYEITLEYNNQKIKTTGFLDTGNKIIFKNSPVNFIDYQLFFKLTNIKLEDFLTKNYQLNNVDYVDINTLAGNKKFLLLRLNQMKVKNKDMSIIVKNPQLAVSLKLVNKDYQLILNDGIL